MTGDWTFYREADPDSGKPMIRTDWQITDETNRSLTFTNILAGNEGEGDILTYNVADTDLSMSFFDASKNETAQINWDAVTTAGCIEAPNYNNGIPGCWDENHDDIP